MHWTGGTARLDRLTRCKDRQAYAFEELVAEICAAFCCAALGIVPTVRHADYIGSWLDVLREDYLRTARAKGMPEHRVIIRHALKPAMLPVISYLGPVFVSMITGSVVIDIYFSTGGIGKAFVDSALNRDYAVMMGITILVGALTIFFNLLVDVLYAWIDPKIRY